MSFAVGSLVKARGREWVVLPDSADELLVVRPLGGTEDEVTGLYLPLEKVESAQFDLPDPTRPGDLRAARLLRDATRLGFRSSAGPFRSFSRIGVEPRPYQLVPLLLALKLDPVRLLIADDVGIGKTIEAGLIARELLDRGEIERLVVLCPPQLAEQWQTELRDKFHLEAELVLSGTAARLEKNVPLGQSLFEIYPYTIVSTDFIKSERRREDFLRACPELVIVDEAHTCASTGENGSGQQQRHRLLVRLAQNPDRHLILVTATPHSGNEEAFRSLLTLLDKDFDSLPEDLSGAANEIHRRRLADHFVQRRRGNIRHYMAADTPFPNREETDESYKLSPDYKKLFEKVLRYARETVTDASGTHHMQRVRWWSALALLRSLGSSPAAAAATLRNRAQTASTSTVEEADELGRRTLLDMVEEQSAEGTDLVPGSDWESNADGSGAGSRNHRRLLEMAREAEALLNQGDEKLKKAIKITKELMAEGYQPIIFCRFVPTAEYLAAALRQSLGKDVEVVAVTGLLAPAERETRVKQVGQAPKRVLVATDCLSEGINLQEYFNAVFHYDLSWNPTRHEQREGRVDRYGQPESKVKVITYYGLDNQIDGIVLEILIQKHKKIRNSLGISVPVPINTDQVVEAIFEGLLLRENAVSPQSAAMRLPGFEEWYAPVLQVRDQLFKTWDAAAEREKRSRSIFAQESIKVEEVAHELEAVRSVIGSGQEVERFTRTALMAHGAIVSDKKGLVEADLNQPQVPRGLREVMGNLTKIRGRFELPVRDGEVYLSRTHPVVEGLASYILDTALDPLTEGVARRCGVIRTSAVERRTTLLLLRLRYHILVRKGASEKALLAEDSRLAAFSGPPREPHWLDQAEAETLLQAEASANILPDQAAQTLTQVLTDFDLLQPAMTNLARQRGQELLDAHRRVREASRSKGISYRVEPQLPPDVLGLYIYLPVAKAL